MGMVNIHFLILAIFTLAGILISSPKFVNGQGCAGDIQGLVTQCGRFVQKAGPKVAPSPACCSVVKAANVPCICQSVTKAVEQAVSMEKVVYVAQTCGKPLSHGAKCGISSPHDLSKGSSISSAIRAISILKKSTINLQRFYANSMSHMKRGAYAMDNRVFISPGLEVTKCCLKELRGAFTGSSSGPKHCNPALDDIIQPCIATIMANMY
ncbi:Bifunctional inhibitor/plant lipid transfer protein/seed storage helical domain [Dillenia turbinata]|uniref:Bifunctional inhibitor/plant lipid transfer protein/seed storage helical domain n=1 Tax=Dillenia turbinata TaxID=194707 RepID=A0AAN8V769_9MAGN